MRTDAFAVHAGRHDHGACIGDALDAAERICGERGLRLTPLRRRVLELVWNGHRPRGAYDILDDLAEGGRRPAPLTVYRALEFLVEHGLVHRLESVNGFVGCPHPAEHHATQFLVCTSCGLAAELNDPRIAEAIGAGARDAGFRIGRQVVEIQGLCPNCAG